MTTTEHGGQRQGAGRPRQFEALQRKTVSLPADLVRELEQLGEGNLSAGIRSYKESIMEQIARSRVSNSPALYELRDIILADWHEGDEHLEWVATAPEAEILDWAQDIRNDIETHPAE